MIAFHIFWFAYLALLLLSASIWKESMWGANSWGFISQTAGFLLFLIVIAGYSWKRFRMEGSPGGWNEGEKGGQIEDTSSVDSSKDSARALKGTATQPIPLRDSVIFIIVSAIVLFLLRSRHHFWGEAAIYPEAFSSISPSAVSSPVAWLINWLAYKFLNSILVLDPSSSAAFVSFTAGVVFVIIGFLVVREMEKISDEKNSFIPLLFILLNGYIAVFFTMGKSSAATLFTLLFLYSSILFIEGKSSILWVTIFFLLGLFCQPGTVFIAPPYIFLLYIASKRTSGNEEISPNASVAVALAVVAAASFASLLIKSANPVTHLSKLTIASLKNTFVEASNTRSYWLDLVNEILLLGPAAIAALTFLFIGNPGREEARSNSTANRISSFLTIAAGSGLIVTVFSAWRIDGGLNWHIVASVGPVLAIYAFWKVMRLFGKKYMRAVYLLALLGAFQTAPWLVVNSSENLATKRLLSLPLPPGKSEMILGKDLYKKGNLDRALEYLSNSVEKDPKHAETFCLLGKIYMKEDKYPDAIARFTSALEIDSTNVEYRFLLADAFIKNRWMEDAIEELEHLVNRYPDSARFWQKLGYACNHSARYEKAVAAYRKSMELKPDRSDYKQNLASALINRGAELQEKKKVNEARSCYLEAIKLVPTAWQAYNNLISIEITEGNLEIAEKMLKEVLKINPYAPELNLNMANLLEKKGKIEKAIEYFERSKMLDPKLEGLNKHIDSLKKNLEGKTNK